MCERLLNLQEIYVSGQNICIEVYGNSVGTITPDLDGKKCIPIHELQLLSAIHFSSNFESLLCKHC